MAAKKPTAAPAAPVAVAVAAAKPAKPAKPAPAVAAAKPAKPAPAPKPDRIAQNGVTRPKDGGKCALVWDIADKLSAKLKAPAPAKDVMEAAVAAGANVANTRAEYQRWRKFNGLSGRLAAKTA